MSLVLCCGQLHAQCPPRSRSTIGSSSKSSAEALLPESGLLTDDTYTNLYFGFSFHLPLSIHGHRLMLPLSPPGEHALFAMGFQDNRRYGTLEITAGGNSAEYDQRITPDQAQQREDDIARSKPGAPKSPRLHSRSHQVQAQRQAWQVRSTLRSTRRASGITTSASPSRPMTRLFSTERARQLKK